MRCGGGTVGVVGAHVEVWKPGGPAVVPLAGDRISIGNDGSNEVAVAWDTAVSRMHAALERYPAGWVIRDLTSRNGTYVNGERVIGERPLRRDDEIRVGTTRIVFRDAPGSTAPKTTAAEGPPELTRRERDVLVALCRPLLSGDMFTGPGSIHEIAADLVVTENAAKQHLHRLYAKFEITGAGDRRARLANEALRRGAVSLADLRERIDRDEPGGR